VVRIDANLNLALLYCVDAKNAKSLPLGAIDGVHELIELYTFGFPVAPGRPSESEFPAIQVQVGTVSALQRKGGQVNRVQLGVLANPSGSGGPVLDASGKVVGMVDSGEGPARAARADFGTRSAREI
jgi:S1-C subfamily serine protease